ncbi:MAG: hypothetical protein UW86_C0001G0005 [Microgenomates group bacterium GW2011_GWA1_Microgenomates_45_10]|nr:MAG: hypothetical protein UW69_C0050G0004 [Microgenomates group bacterium GW2011_GWA2_44_7]KKT87452.1 MAG: hypothetical protein UW86_C0001G0005 [Microgenomates group bacterium GW2011_GWA1_Microgenomates_45_10]
MDFAIDRRKLEQMTASLAVLLLFFLTFGAIVAFANIIFEWDIFPPSIERALWFVFAAVAVVIFTSVLVNIMLNISLIALNAERLTKITKENGRKS